MRRLLIEIGSVGFMSGAETDFKIRINTENINKTMIKDILNSLEKALEQCIVTSATPRPHNLSKILKGGIFRWV